MPGASLELLFKLNSFTRSRPVPYRLLHGTCCPPRQNKLCLYGVPDLKVRPPFAEDLRTSHVPGLAKKTLLKGGTCLALVGSDQLLAWLILDSTATQRTWSCKHTVRGGGG